MALRSPPPFERAPPKTAPAVLLIMGSRALRAEIVGNPPQMPLERASGASGNPRCARETAIFEAHRAGPPTVAGEAHPTHSGGSAGCGDHHPCGRTVAR